MRTRLLLFVFSSLMVACACGNMGSQYNNNQEENNGDTHDTISSISDSDYLGRIDEYVNSVRENIEQTSIVKHETNEEKMVLFMKDSDTIKISVLEGSGNANTDIYFKNSTPVFMIRNIILDVDSNYMETAYFKNGKIFKCFRDGVETSDINYHKNFEEILGDK